MKTLGFGKFKDVPIEQVPESYLQWLINSNKQKIADLEAELARRALVDMASGTWIERIIKSGYRALMKQYHPDTGGTTEDATAINAAYEKLKKEMEWK